MKVLSLLLSILLIASSAVALPFNDDMVENQLGPGQLSLKRPEGTVPRGSLEYTVKTKEEALALTNPVYADKYSVSRGERLFQVHCAACHGEIEPGNHVIYPAGKFLPGPNLSDAPYHSRTDGALYGTIHFGSAIMKPVGWKLTQDETWDIVNYIRHKQGQAKK